MDNRLEINLKNGEKTIIRVLDIIDSNVYNKSFIIYTLENDNSTIFASILNETETTYSLDTIIDKEEINYINSEIDRVISENDLVMG